MTCSRNEATDQGPAWSDEAIRQHWLAEINARFDRENAIWRAVEQRDIEKLTPEQRDSLPENIWAFRNSRNSGRYEIWKASEVRLYSNMAEVVLPDGYAFHYDLVMMFEHAEVNWSLVQIEAVLVDGKARVQLAVNLIDYWSDERSAQWREDNPGTHPDVLEVIERFKDD